MRWADHVTMHHLGPVDFFEVLRDDWMPKPCHHAKSNRCRNHDMCFFLHAEDPDHYGQYVIKEQAAVESASQSSGSSGRVSPGHAGGKRSPKTG